MGVSVRRAIGVDVATAVASRVVVGPGVCTPTVGGVGVVVETTVAVVLCVGVEIEVGMGVEVGDAQPTISRIISNPAAILLSNVKLLIVAQHP